MPELPEVETMCRGIAAVVGREIRLAARVRCQRRPIQVTPSPGEWKKNAHGQTIAAVSRIGKRVILELSNACRIVFEPRMTGLVLLAEPPTTEHLRFEVRLTDPRPAEFEDPERLGQPLRLLFWDRRGLGSVRLLTPQQFVETFQSGKVGPDALGVSPSQLQSIFGDCRQAIKPALLDQKKLAGVGNLYASELLFRAKIRPTLLCCELRPPQWKRIHQQMQFVLQQAIAYEGSTLNDGTYRNALNKEGGYQNHHQVYGKAGETCVRCQHEIVRMVQTQRATFYCPNCQK